MSGGAACKCRQAREPIGSRAWRVVQYRGNHSAFSGYRWTPSEYSSVMCLECGAMWRTKAKFVDQLEK